MHQRRRWMIGGVWTAWWSYPPALVCAEEAAITADAVGPRGFWGIVLAGGWTGIGLFLVLLGLSITALYLVFDNLMVLRKRVVMPEGLATRVRKHLEAGQTGEAVAACQAQASPLAFVLLQGLEERMWGWPAVEKALEDALAEQAAGLFRRIEYLSVIGNLAPMVGLLGTVTGMIFAFQSVADTQGAASAGELAEGIYQALVTTVFGLVIAIPALGAFAILRNRVDQMMAEMAYSIQHTMTPLKRLSHLPPMAAPRVASGELP